MSIWPNPSSITVSDLAAWIEDAAGYSVLTRPRRIAIARAFGMTPGNTAPSIEEILMNPAASNTLGITPLTASTSVITPTEIQKIKTIFIQ